MLCTIIFVYAGSSGGQGPKGACGKWSTIIIHWRRKLFASWPFSNDIEDDFYLPAKIATLTRHV